MTEELNSWGGWIINNGNGNTAVVSIWKLPGIWKKGKDDKYFYDKTDGPRFHSRIDVNGKNAATIYVSIQDNSLEAKDRGGYRDAKSREELIPYIKWKLEKLGFSSDGIENCKTKISYTGNPMDYIEDPDYNPDDHIKQAQFLQKILKVQGDVKYRLSNPDEFDDK